MSVCRGCSGCNLYCVSGIVAVGVGQELSHPSELRPTLSSISLETFVSPSPEDILPTGALTTRWNLLTPRPSEPRPDPEAEADPSLLPDILGRYVLVESGGSALGGVGTSDEPETVDASVKPKTWPEDADECTGEAARST